MFHRTSWLDDSDRAEVAGIPVTSVTRTLLDLAEVCDGQILARAFEEAERRRVLQLARLQKLVLRARGRHGLPVIRAVISAHLEPENVRSELERLFSELCTRERLPYPSFNVLVEGHLVDCLWPAEKLVVELDGYSHHHTQAAFERDHARDLDLEAAGYSVRRYTWRQLRTQGDRVAEVLRARAGSGPLPRPSRA